MEMLREIAEERLDWNVVILAVELDNSLADKALSDPFDHAV
jgi:hypothetical protein